jgi:hypothetical protein
MQGLSIAVPQGGTGANIDAFASYAPVGAANGGVTTTTTGDITSLVNLSYVKYTIGGTTSTLCANGDSPTGGNCTASTSMPISSTQTMTLVGSKPTVTVAAPTGVSILPSTATEAIDVTISADQAGPITMVSFPINVALTGAGSSGTLTVATGGGNPFIVKDLNYSTNGLSATGSFSAGSGGAATVTLNSTTGYLLGAGQSQTFRVYIPVATVTSGGTSSWYNRISTYMPTGTGFVWADTAGGANANTASVTAAIFNYPNNTTVAVQQ